MDIIEAIYSRHSVRQYNGKPLSTEHAEALRKEITAVNSQTGLNIQLVVGEERAFTGLLAHYGKFKGVVNYIALVGKKSSDLNEKVGYYGEKLVLIAQALGLNTCWIALTVKKGVVINNCAVEKGEKLACVIAIGYGENNGVQHKSKDINRVAKWDSTAPEWFFKGVEYALLAPTAINQQKFLIEWKNSNAFITRKGGFYGDIDLGIIKYHFEQAKPVQ